MNGYDNSEWTTTEIVSCVKVSWFPMVFFVPMTGILFHWFSIVPIAAGLLLYGAFKSAASETRAASCSKWRYVTKQSGGVMHRFGVAVRAGATTAEIEEVYRRRHAGFLRLGYALLGSSDLARDAVQETFATALRSRGSFRREGSLDGWLWRTMLNTCRQEQRRRSRLAETEPPELSSNGRAADWPELRAAIAALPERERLAVFLRYYAELTQEEAADALGIRPGTVAAALNHAREKLRTALETEVTQ